MDEARGDMELVPGRNCDGCVMCCKVFPIPETGKDDFALCPHARVGEGCGNYDSRPETCREFFCLWRLDGSLEDDWKPSVAGFVLHDPAPWTLLVSGDVYDPDARQREPYASQIRQWAFELKRRQMLMGARCGDTTRLLLGDREVDLDG